MSSNDIWDILRRQNSPARLRRNDALRIRMLDEVEAASMRGSLHNSRFPIVLGRMAAADLEPRAEALLEVLDAGLSQADYLWTSSTGDDAKAFVDAELDRDVSTMEEMLRDRLKNIWDPYLDDLEAARARLKDQLHADIDLRVHSQVRRRLPLEDKMGARRYESALAGWRAASDLARKDGTEPGDVARAAVAAVEELARVVNSTPSKTLGAIINDLKSAGSVQAPLLKSLEEIWGWTSSQPGARHGAASPGTVDQSSADYVVRVSEAAMHLLLDVDAL